MVLKLKISEDIKALAEARAAEAGHATLDDYMAALIRQDSEVAVPAESERELLAGLDSGPAI